MEEQKRLRSIIALSAAILIAWSPGFLGAILFATGEDSWYQQLDKPWFNPPNWIFGPVWSILYIGIGISLYLVWSRGVRSPAWYRLMTVFGVQLVLNGLWTPAFFGLESPVAGLIVIIPMLVSIAATIWLAKPYSGWAALLLVPYLMWVSFATLLNFSIWQLNP